MCTVEADAIDYHDLMKQFKLETHLKKMAETTLPTTYLHLIRGVGEKPDTSDIKGDLAGLLKGVPFDRPIDPLPESVVKSALQLPPASKLGPTLYPMKGRTLHLGLVDTHTHSWLTCFPWILPALNSIGQAQGLVHDPPLTQKEKSSMEDKLKSKARDDKDRKEKKEKKKKKREREDATMLQKVLAPLITELRALTWTQWIVSGKAGNPFLQVKSYLSIVGCGEGGGTYTFFCGASVENHQRQLQAAWRAQLFRLCQGTDGPHAHEGMVWSGWLACLLKRRIDK